MKIVEITEEQLSFSESKELLGDWPKPEHVVHWFDPQVDTKYVFKTAIEIDQRWLIDLAADRTEMIDQAQSLNVFVPADSNKKYIHDIHYSAWKKGVKSLYYCRSQSIQRAETGSSNETAKLKKPVEEEKPKGKSLDEMVAESSINDDDYDECLSCQ